MKGDIKDNEKIQPSTDRRCRLYKYMGDHPKLYTGKYYGRQELSKAFGMSDSWISQNCKHLKVITDDDLVFVSKREGFVHHTTKIHNNKKTDVEVVKKNNPSKSWLSRKLV